MSVSAPFILRPVATSLLAVAVLLIGLLGYRSLSVSALEALEADGTIDHKTFLALTRPVRVVDEVGVMAAVRKDPKILAALAKATTPGKKSTAINVRPKK